jgi:hypothetical protein
MIGGRHSRSLLSRTRARLAQERGSTIVVFAVMLPVLLLLAAMVIDIGTMRQARQQAQSAADAGALAGAGANIAGTLQTQSATTDAVSLAQGNDAAASTSVTAPFGNDPEAVKVVVSKQIPLLFGGLLGSGSGRVSATAVASSDLGTPLAYFGGDDSDLQDGSATSDGWDNFCAGSSLPAPPPPLPPFTADTESHSTDDSDDPPRCPADAAPSNESLDGWDLVHGGIDISRANFFSPPGTSDQMVDLTGTCVERSTGSFPSPQSGNTTITLNGVTTHNDGYCENNADGEIEETLPTKIGQTYTVNFWLGSNTWGYPSEKPLMVIASNKEASSLPPMADTDGDSTYQSSTSKTYGTVYPLETSPSWPSYGGEIVAHEEFFYYGPAGGATNPDWVQQEFTFIATASTTYLVFGGLTNCSADWISTSKLNNGYFYPTTLSSSSPPGAASTTDWVPPPQQVNDDVQNPYQNQCKYGAGVSDVTISGSGTVSLTQ